MVASEVEASELDTETEKQNSSGSDYGFSSEQFQYLTSMTLHSSASAPREGRC